MRICYLLSMMMVACLAKLEEIQKFQQLSQAGIVDDNGLINQFETDLARNSLVYDNGVGSSLQDSILFAISLNALSDDAELVIPDLLHSSKKFVFLNEHGNIVAEPGMANSLAFSMSSSFQELIILPLSEPLFLGLASAIFVGHGFFLLMEGADQRYYHVNLATGKVTSMGYSGIGRWEMLGDGWVTIVGVAEQISPTEVHIWYKSLDGMLERQIVGDSKSATNHVLRVPWDASF